MTDYNSVCPYDCPDACGLIVRVENNQVIGVRGNTEHAFTRGTVCPKMAHYERTIHSPERLTTPLKRVGKKGVGLSEFVPISWDEALDVVTRNFKETIANYGGESILRYSFAGTMGNVQGAAGDYFFRCLGATDQDGGICATAKQAAFKSVYGTTIAMKPQEAQHSDFIILWGINATATNVHILHDINMAKRKGAQVWIIDTHETYTFDQAHHHMYVKPGTDGALALGLMHIIHREGLDDRAFIDRYVQGYDELVLQVLPQFTPQRVAEICDVSVEQLMKLAIAYGKAKAPFIRLGSGLSRYGNGSMNCRCINALPAVVGAWQHLGGGLQSSARTGEFIHKEHMQNPSNPIPAKRVMPMIVLGELLTNPNALYEHGLEMVPNETSIHSIYIYSTNPAITAPNQNLVRQGLMRDDLFVIVHERFFTDTCNYADIILPATSSVEHNDIYNPYGHYSLGVGYQLIEPIGESKSNWHVIAALAERMGLNDPFFKMSEVDHIKAIIADAPGLSEEEQEQLLQGKPVEIRLPENHKLDFKTPSGKIELLNPQERIPLITYIEPYGDNAPFWLINGNDIRILDSSFCELDHNDPEPMKLRINPLDAKVYSINDGDLVEIYNDRGTVQIKAYVDEDVRCGTVVSLGVWWQRQSSDPYVGINALTSSRPTDEGWGSTFYDVQVYMRKVFKAN